MPVYSIDSSSYQLRATHAIAAPAVLRTSASHLDGLPAPLLSTGAHIWLGAVTEFVPPSGAASWLVWRQGETWLQGSATHLRAALRLPSRRYFLPVHYPYWSAAAIELDLIGIEPRIFSASAQASQDSPDALDSIETRIRLRAAAADSAGNGGTEPWQHLRTGLAAEAAQAGAGVAALAQLAQEAGWHPILRALCLRNLVIAVARRDGWEAAGGLLEQACGLFPDYRELDFLTALRAVVLGHPAEALTALRRATAPGAPLAVGSGGEAGYRAHYLLALIAQRTGNQAVAVHHFLTGVRRTPAFAPSVAGVLSQRLSPGLLATAQGDLTRVGRRESQYQRPIFDFVLLHRAWELAERALRTWPLSAALAADFDRRWVATAALRNTVPRPATAAAGIAIAGPVQMYSSVAGINRQLAAALCADHRFEIAIDPTAADVPLASFRDHACWSPALTRLPARLDLTIRHGWPPEFSRPATGKLALILPWEFGAIPQSWQRALKGVDRVFVPSAFVRDVFTGAGVEAARVSVIPNGVDLELYHPEGPTEVIPGSRGVKFLFVGGAIQRKGMDLLLRAWRAAFSGRDDVSLIIKDLGAGSFYRHLTLRRAIAQQACDPQAAPIIYLDEPDDAWPDTRMPGLYRAADVLVLPYRGEGFGLPLAEALACGKPVITTACGPAPEFCCGAGWLVPAAEVEVPPALRPAGMMSGPLTWFEPELTALTAALVAAAQQPRERAARGALGADHIRRHLGWSGITQRYRQEIADLTGATGVIPA